MVDQKEHRGHLMCVLHHESMYLLHHGASPQAGNPHLSKKPKHNARKTETMTGKRTVCESRQKLLLGEPELVDVVRAVRLRARRTLAVPALWVGFPQANKRRGGEVVRGFSQNVYVEEYLQHRGVLFQWR